MADKSVWPVSMWQMPQYGRCLNMVCLNMADVLIWQMSQYEMSQYNRCLNMTDVLKFHRCLNIENFSLLVLHVHVNRFAVKIVFSEFKPTL